MKNNFSKLRKLNNLKQVVEHPLYYESFVKKYIADLPKMAIEVFNINLTWQQYLVLENVNFAGGRLLVPSGHGSGKTFLIGFISIAYMLLFPQSLVRIQAPQSKQVTNFSFKEIRDKIDSLTKVHKHNDRTFISPWSFLAKFFVFNNDKIYVKGFNKSWYIEPASAPKGDPTNLSGQHNRFYLLIFDEMSGIPDTHINGSLGGISEKLNSVVGFSQHTELSGKFHEFVENQNIETGGSWQIIRLNSEQSPRVNKKQLEAWKSSYDENEYNVRVLGLKPLYDENNLINTTNARFCYDNKKIWIKKEFKTLVLSVDVAFTGNYDASVILSARLRVELDNETNEEVVFIIVDKIQRFQGDNKVRPTRLVDLTIKELHEFQDLNPSNDCQIITDANSGGDEIGLILQDRADESSVPVVVHKLKWGAKCNGKSDRARYNNRRAKAYVMLKRCVDNGRLYFNTNKEKTRVLKEITNIPFKFTNKGYKIDEKHEMKSRGIHSPDIVDTLAQLFLINLHAYDSYEDEVIEPASVEVGDTNSNEEFSDFANIMDDI